MRTFPQSTNNDRAPATAPRTTRRRHELVQFGANCMSSWQEPYCTHKEYLFLQSGTVKNGQKSRCVHSEPPPVKKGAQHSAGPMPLFFAASCFALQNVPLCALSRVPARVIGFFDCMVLSCRRPPLSSHVECSEMRHARGCKKLCCVSAPEDAQMLSSLPCRAALETVSPYRPQLIRGLCCIGSPEREHPGHGDKR